MKFFFSLLFLLSFPCLLFSQNPRVGYEIKPNYRKAVMLESLQTAETMSDINPGYPKSWIEEEDYISTEIVIGYEGEERIALGKNEKLNSEQMCVLKQAGIGTKISVKVNYHAKNAVTQEKVLNTMEFACTVVPKIEANFPQGYDKLRAYIKETVMDKISQDKLSQLNLALIHFVIDEEGKCTNTSIRQSSGDKSIDQLLITSLKNMPKWEAAQDDMGKPVKQDFELQVGKEIGC
ncbi:MAG: hypothetical protein AAF696_24745 [Bacteroidota bacterium]